MKDIILTKLEFWCPGYIEKIGGSDLTLTITTRSVDIANAWHEKSDKLYDELYHDKEMDQSDMIGFYIKILEDMRYTEKP